MWLYDRESYYISGYRGSPGSEHYTSSIEKAALRVGKLELAKKFVPRGHEISDFVTGFTREEVLRRCGCGPSEGVDLAWLLYEFARTSRLDLVARIIGLHYDPQGTRDEWAAEWVDTAKQACVRGYMPLVTWMVDLQTKHGSYGGLDNRGGGMEPMDQLLTISSEYENIAVMQYLFDHGRVQNHKDALLSAVRKGRVESVKLLASRIRPCDQHSLYSVLAEAARHGQLDMLKFIQSMDLSTTSWLPPPEKSLKLRCREVSRGLAEERYKDQLPWDWLSSSVMDQAAETGNLAVLEWLDTSHQEGCSKDAMDREASMATWKWCHG